MATFILIHGGWAGGWCWEKIAPRLRDAGNRVVAPDLRGHGADRTPAGDITLKTYVDQVVELLVGEPEPVVLVGHSSGGIIISQAAEQRPERVQTLVYVCAYLPADGDSLFALGRRDTETILLPNLVVADHGQTVHIRPDVVRDALFSDCRDEDVTRAMDRFIVDEPMSIAATTVNLSAARFGRVPKAYVECLRDRAISPTLQREMYTAAGCQRVFSMNTGHSPHYAAPDQLAAHLLSLAECSPATIQVRRRSG